MPTIRRRGKESGNKYAVTGISAVSLASDAGGPLERAYVQCYLEARYWFYVNIVAVIVATLVTLVVVGVIVQFVLFGSLSSSSLVATLASAVSSMINGVITYLVFTQKRYANERLDAYAQRISKKDREEGSEEKIRRLIAIVLDSHLSKEEQSELIKQIIARMALVSSAPSPEPTPGKQPEHLL
jgi:hypothetical protein